MRLGTIERSAFIFPSFATQTHCLDTSARIATQRQFMIDVLDVWLPATGAELVNVNEGVLSIIGFVRFIHLARPLFSDSKYAVQPRYLLDGNKHSVEGGGRQELRKGNVIESSCLAGGTLMKIILFSSNGLESPYLITIHLNVTDSCYVDGNSIAQGYCSCCWSRSRRYSRRTSSIGSGPVLAEKVQLPPSKQPWGDILLKHTILELLEMLPTRPRNRNSPPTRTVCKF
jgi:hypothetical protein